MSGFLGDATALIGPGLAAALGNTSAFRTRPAPNQPPALYSLAIRSGSMPFLPYFIYTFPISPANLRKEFGGMGNFYDVQGPPGSFGVTRVPDVYGMSPPIYTIAGTTGVKYHSTDRYLYTGLQSVLILQGAIAQYFALCAAAVQDGASQIPRLEFYDFFQGDFYQVLPLGPQGVSQDSSRPQLVNYQFRLIAIQSLLEPLLSDLDSILSPLTQGIGQGITGLDNSMSSALGSYSPFSPG